MKKMIKHIFIGVLILTWVACQHEEIPPITHVFMNNITIEPSYTSAVITCNVASSITVEKYIVHLSKVPDFSNSQQYILNQLVAGSFSDTISGLEDDMTYYVRYGIYNSWSAIEFDTVSVFKTLKGSIPTVSTSKVDMVTLNSAIVYGQVVEDGGFPITEYGFCYSTSPSPTIEDVKLICENSVHSFSYNIVNLQEGTKYYIRSYAQNEKGITYGEELCFSTKVRTYHNGYEYVDLGLSVKWATCNVGANVPEEYGGYYAWGEIETKSTYDWTTHKYYDSTTGSFLKYNDWWHQSGVHDNKMTLDPSDDVAHINWGGNWRMPDEDELRELRDKCTLVFCNQNGVQGYRITSTVNGCSIFVPASGKKVGKQLDEVGDVAYFWSINRIEQKSEYAVYMKVSSPYLQVPFTDRCYGFSVRPVCR
jgi:uncharacterized protein (TIGR02145 family)